jgi:micrococcal nuclease
MEKKHAMLISFLITGLIATNIFLLKPTKNPETSIVARIIDGDTLVLKDGKIIRLISINTPERGQHGSEAATNFLKQLENQSIQIKTLNQDKYQRTLARIYTNNYINLEIVKQGLGNKYILDSKEEASIFATAEAQAIKQELGLWKSSPHKNCIETEILSKESIKITNTCQPINIQDWYIKDESRKSYKFNNLYLSEITLHSEQGNDNQSDIHNSEITWNKLDSVYIFDNNNLFVHSSNHGY